MTLKKELIIARKEFNDFLTSKRFLVIIGALLLLSIVGIISGISDYDSQLDTYRENMQVANQSTNIGPRFTEMPSVLLVFEKINDYFLIIGLALSVSMGFDLISREKEDGSLKSLLTHPVYRDSIINGKAIGSISMLIVVLAAMFLITIALMLFSGLVPTGDELVRICAYFAMTVLYCVTLFAISLAMSTIAKSSAMSVAYTLGIVLAVVLLPMLSSNIVSLVMGEPPEAFIITAGAAQTDNTGQQFPDAGGNRTRNMNMAINSEYTEYWNQRNQITGTINMASPLNNFQSISEVLLQKLKSPSSSMQISSDRNVVMFSRLPEIEINAADSLSSVIGNILSLLVMAIAALGASYVKFMRLDVR
jgi:ABC-2 type transport system permease protein